MQIYWTLVEGAKARPRGGEAGGFGRSGGGGKRVGGPPGCLGGEASEGVAGLVGYAGGLLFEPVGTDQEEAKLQPVGEA